MDRDSDSDTVAQLSDGDSVDFEASLERLRGRVAFADATVATTLPRAGLQIVQPRQADPHRQRLYVREVHALDAVGWHAMSTGRVTRDTDLPSRMDEHALPEELRPVADDFRERFLRPHGLAHYCAVPIVGVVLPGYPALLQLFRTNESDPFDDDEIRDLQARTAEFASAFESLHARRQYKHNDYPLNHKLAQQQFACTRGRRVLFPHSGGAALDDVLRQNLLDAVERRLDDMNGLDGRLGETANDAQATTMLDGKVKPEAAGSNADRLLVADHLGDCWAFRVTLFPAYPALTGSASEPVAFVSHQPDCESWSALRADDFAADEELARLVPSLHYMQEHYRGDISLREIAKTVYLSPFHFHRRFTDLLGITPKHYLFDCQISEAKRRLAAEDMSLKQIAEHCGFAHQSHFTSRFKQATGLTPTAWRRLAREGAGASATD